MPEAVEALAGGGAPETEGEADQLAGEGDRDERIEQAHHGVGRALGQARIGLDPARLGMQRTERGSGRRAEQAVPD